MSEDPFTDPLPVSDDGLAEPTPQPKPVATTDLRPLHPKIRSVWRMSSIASGLFGAVLFGGPALAMASALDGPKVFVAVMAALIGFMLFGGIGFFLADRQFEQWRYQLREFDVLIKKGLVWRSERYIARDRIQHIDINNGPIDRKFGLVQVVIYAAGIAGSVGLIPGLTPEEAEWLKEQLLASRSEEA